MTSVEVMRNSILHVIMAHDPEDVAGMTDALTLMWIVDQWTHTEAEIPIKLSALTDAEFRMVVTWFHMTRNQYDNKIQHIKDMREVFPGLGLAAANTIVRG